MFGCLAITHRFFNDVTFPCGPCDSAQFTLSLFVSLSLSLFLYIYIYTYTSIYIYVYMSQRFANAADLIIEESKVSVWGGQSHPWTHQVVPAASWYIILELTKHLVHYTKVDYGVNCAVRTTWLSENPQFFQPNWMPLSFIRQGLAVKKWSFWAPGEG